MSLGCVASKVFHRQNLQKEWIEFDDFIYEVKRKRAHSQMCANISKSNEELKDRIL